MPKNNAKANEVNQTGLYWPGKRTEIERVILPFQVVETINESKADREKAQRDAWSRGLDSYLQMMYDRRCWLNP